MGLEVAIHHFDHSTAHCGASSGAIANTAYCASEYEAASFVDALTIYTAVKRSAPSSPLNGSADLICRKQRVRDGDLGDCRTLPEPRRVELSPGTLLERVVAETLSGIRFKFGIQLAVAEAKLVSGNESDGERHSRC